MYSFHGCGFDGVVLTTGSWTPQLLVVLQGDSKKARLAAREAFRVLQESLALLETTEVTWGVTISMLQVGKQVQGMLSDLPRFTQQCRSWGN